MPDSQEINTYRRLLIIGGSVGSVCMVISTIVVFSILVLRNKFKKAEIQHEQRER